MCRAHVCMPVPVPVHHTRVSQPVSLSSLNEWQSHNHVNRYNYFELECAYGRALSTSSSSSYSFSACRFFLDLSRVYGVRVCVCCCFLLCCVVSIIAWFWENWWESPWQSTQVNFHKLRLFSGSLYRQRLYMSQHREIILLKTIF